MAAIVVPFPAARRRSFIMKHAANAAAMPQRTAEKYVAAQIKVQTDTMARRGIAPELIEEQRRALEGAIRAELWRLVLMPEGYA